MKAEIKRCYNYLDLPFDATIQDVELRQKVMIKIYRAKALKTNKSYQDKIDRINNSALTLIDFIDKNGVQKPAIFSFKPSAEDIYGELFVLLIVMMLCVTSFILLL